jgi:hypothetical protein
MITRYLRDGAARSRDEGRQTLAPYVVGSGKQEKDGRRKEDHVSGSI